MTPQEVLRHLKNEGDCTHKAISIYLKILPSNPPPNGKIFMYQKYLESKKQQEEQKKKKREKTNERRKEKEEIKEKLQATTSYCKEQDWTFAS
jgi:hypothetical protein